MAETLRESIRRSCVQLDSQKAFPTRAWAYINGKLHEAKITNQVSGEHHGFPLEYESQEPDDPHDLLEECPACHHPCPLTAGAPTSPPRSIHWNGETWAGLRLVIQGRCVTQFWDRRGNAESEVVYVPTFPLAEWIVENWWALFYGTVQSSTGRPRRRIGGSPNSVDGFIGTACGLLKADSFCLTSISIATGLQLRFLGLRIVRILIQACPAISQRRHRHTRQRRCNHRRKRVCSKGAWLVRRNRRFASRSTASRLERDYRCR